MTTIEVAEKVVAEGTAHLTRPKKGEPGQYDAKPIFTGAKRGWLLLDRFSASAIVAVAKRVSDANREKLNRLSPGACAIFCFRLIKKSRPPLDGEGHDSKAISLAGALPWWASTLT